VERDLQIQELGGGTQELQTELERLRAEMQMLQANEQEQRIQMRDMSHKIDEKDDQIEQLRWQIQQQSANYRQLFKQTMSAPGKGGEAEKLSQSQLTKAFGFDPELYNEQKNNIDQLHKENIDLRELLMEL
jgi:chromosome segregation ATPase